MRLEEASGGSQCCRRDRRTAGCPEHTEIPGAEECDVWWEPNQSLRFGSGAQRQEHRILKNIFIQIGVEAYDYIKVLLKNRTNSMCVHVSMCGRGGWRGWEGVGRERERKKDGRKRENSPTWRLIYFS